ncbi:MAG: phosphatase PAP2 family protein [Clostridiales bacterium]|nr:phosphatase PAP2 family protein [Clostridiales bacterium]MDY3746685.1 phosphatase PAP2 family protein [Lachnospiraceae bacterium]
MKKETYEKIIRYFEASKMRSLLLEGVAEILPLTMALIYGCLCFVLLINKNPIVWRFAAVPAIVFIFVTAFRTVVDRKRPYAKLGFVPFLKYKEKKGKSFPSRHTASAFIIAFACFYFNAAAGIVMLFAAAAVAASRVLTGMHYISDVIAGIVISMAAAWLGYYVFI